MTESQRQRTDRWLSEVREEGREGVNATIKGQWGGDLCSHGTVVVVTQIHEVIQLHTITHRHPHTSKCIEMGET